MLLNRLLFLPKLFQFHLFFLFHHIFPLAQPNPSFRSICGLHWPHHFKPSLHFKQLCVFGGVREVLEAVAEEGAAIAEGVLAVLR